MWGAPSYDDALDTTHQEARNDLRAKVTAYAEAKIPVHVIVNRKHGRVHVLTEPIADGYDSHQVYAPGRQVSLPASIGAEVTLDVADLLKAGQHRK